MSDDTLVERHAPPTATNGARPATGLSPLTLHPDRYFDPDPAIRRVARALAKTTYKFDRAPA